MRGSCSYVSITARVMDAAESKRTVPERGGLLTQSLASMARHPSRPDNVIEQPVAVKPNARCTHAKAVPVTSLEPHAGIYQTITCQYAIN